MSSALCAAWPREPFGATLAPAKPPKKCTLVFAFKTLPKSIDYGISLAGIQTNSIPKALSRHSVPGGLRSASKCFRESSARMRSRLSSQLRDQSPLRERHLFLGAVFLLPSVSYRKYV